jgi:pyruvate dehydrogenase E2 component (dihydrolipoamide acetyltransferase)
MPLLVKMPKWGLMMKAGTVTEWHRAEGDAVTAGDPLFVVETEKAVNDVEAPADGVLRRIVAEEGAIVPVSGPVGVIALQGESLSDEAVDAFVASQAASAVAAPAAGSVARTTREPRAAERGDDGRIAASPAARKLARELAIDLAAVTATGPGGRITSDDVERAAGEPREQLVTVDGVRIFTLSAGSPATPPVVLIHGIGGSATTWEGVIESVAATHHVVALDLPGHGRSDAPDPARFDYGIEHLAATVLAVLAELRVSRATLAGHSLGGAIAIAAALAAPDRVAGLVLVDSAGLGAEVAPELLVLLDAPPDEEVSRALLGLFFADDRLVLDAGVAEHVAAQQRPGAHAAIGAIRAQAFTDSVQRPIAGAGRVTQPVLVIWGELDRVFPVAHAAVIDGAEVVVIDGAGHVPQIEAPAAFTDALARFLA